MCLSGMLCLGSALIVMLTPECCCVSALFRKPRRSASGALPGKDAESLLLDLAHGDVHTHTH